MYRLWHVGAIHNYCQHDLFTPGNPRTHTHIHTHRLSSQMQESHVRCNFTPLRPNPPSAKDFLFCVIFAPADILSCLSSLSLSSPIWTETKQLHGKVQGSKLLRFSSSLSWLPLPLADTVVGRGKSERKALTANQLTPASLVRPDWLVYAALPTENTEYIFCKTLIPVAKRISC